VDPITYVERLHETVDTLVGPLVERHQARLRCSPGCSDCCVDGLSVFAVEAEVIRRHHGELLTRQLPHLPGACAFLDDSARCRIYAHRPYVCRTQGLPLRWLEEAEDEVREARDICPLNEPGEPIESLTPEECWALGPVERRLAAAQLRWSGAEERCGLRDLFGGG